MSDRFSGPLRVRRLFADAWSTLRERPRRVLGLGIVVSAFTITSDRLLEVLSDDARDSTTGALTAAVVMASVALTAANGFGTTFLSGVLDRTVGEHQHGHPAESLWTLLRRIPYGWLILADILAVVLTVVGFALLVVPGIVVMTLTCIVGPLVMIERRRPFSAVKRSAQLVRPFFWIAFVAVTVPIIGESFLSGAVASAPWLHGFVQHLTVGVLVEAPIAIYVSLVEVTLAYQLIERDRPGSVSATHD
jgi:hypothetical protein